MSGFTDRAIRKGYFGLGVLKGAARVAFLLKSRLHGAKGPLKQLAIHRNRLAS
jgi:hypothetical protein